MKTVAGLAATAVAATALTGCGGLTFDASKRHEDRSYDLTGSFTALKVRGDTGEIEVVGTDSPGIKVRERLTFTNDKNKPRTQRSTAGGVVELSAKCGNIVIGIGSCGISYRVEVPRRLAVDVSADSGAMEVAGLTGALKLKTDTGSIVATDVRTRSLDASAQAGRISVSGQADTASLETDTGFIVVAGLRAKKLTTRTAAGAVKLRLPVPPDSLDTRTDTGSVFVELPRGTRFALDMSTDVGSTKADPALHQDSRSPKKIKVHTETGSIHIAAL
ncbi:DUF4097 family beta strand repeat-containing protein [Spirillospora sp. CA-294931]|uniref:DUF4097 family beta strand repeat-containing protein n=1 Tax=Spirillospora sp. CA-294931 TaxID=3240042 RepID=UPI003D92A30E